MGHFSNQRRIMPFKDINEKRAYDRGYKTGVRIKGRGQSLNELLFRHSGLRKAYNEKLKIAIDKAMKQHKET